MRIWTIFVITLVAAVTAIPVQPARIAYACSTDEEGWLQMVKESAVVAEGWVDRVNVRPDLPPRSLAEKPTESAYRYTYGSHILWSREATDCGIVVGKFRGQVGVPGKAATDARRAWTPAGAV